MKRTVFATKNDNVSVIAAGVAFFSLLAIFPLISAALSIFSSAFAVTSYGVPSAIVSVTVAVSDGKRGKNEKPTMPVLNIVVARTVRQVKIVSVKYRWRTTLTKKGL